MDVDNQNELYTYKVKAGSRSYYFNLKEDKNGELYLVIKESKLHLDGTKDVHRVMVFEKDFSKFVDGFRQTLQFVKSRGNSSSTTTTSDSDENNSDENNNLEEVTIVADDSEQN